MAVEGAIWQMATAAGGSVRDRRFWTFAATGEAYPVFGIGCDHSRLLASRCRSERRIND
ncbi:hypothetical protein [Granulicella pectinivorans]|uniref:hypothetical protein n=1 Tax=Granulicella pectinivorans TaxID=474950 RepID=UPI0015871CC9|nr:hypothetical protein [Granulicella pectinivorans]